MEAELAAFYAEEHKQAADNQDNEEIEDVIVPISTILDTVNDFPRKCRATINMLSLTKNHSERELFAVRSNGSSIQRCI
jgi:hypothetical protein